MHIFNQVTALKCFSTYQMVAFPYTCNKLTKIEIKKKVSFTKASEKYLVKKHNEGDKRPLKVSILRY